MRYYNEIRHYKRLIATVGLSCPRCGNSTEIWRAGKKPCNKQVYQCKLCGFKFERSKKNDAETDP